MPAIRLEPFKLEHAAFLGDCGAQEWLRGYFEDCIESALAGFARSVWGGSDFLGCGGLAPIHPHRAVAWAILRPGFPQYFQAIHRAAREGLRKHLEIYHRIEAYIDPEFILAVRWAKTLGFRQECARKPYFFPDGRTGSEWVMIRGE